MRTATRREYQRLRKLGNGASRALSAAKTRERWAEAEGNELVRLRIEPDNSPDLSFLDQDEFSDCREKEYARANADGVWGVVGEYFDGETWRHVDSCWGFIGEDWKDSGYDVDIMDATLATLDELEHCPACGRPKIT